MLEKKKKYGCISIQQGGSSILVVKIFQKSSSEQSETVALNEEEATVGTLVHSGPSQFLPFLMDPNIRPPSKNLQDIMQAGPATSLSHNISSFGF